MNLCAFQTHGQGYSWIRSIEFGILSNIVLENNCFLKNMYLYTGSMFEPSHLEEELMNGEYYQL